MRNIIAIFVVVIFSVNVLQAQQNGDSLLGIWYNEERTSKIQITKMNNLYYGRIIWLKVPNDEVTGNPKKDKNNPSKEMQSVPLMNLIVLRRFMWTGKNIYEDGLICDPKNGKEYHCKMTLINHNTLYVRGYLGITVLGRTAV